MSTTGLSAAIIVGLHSQYLPRVVAGVEAMGRAIPEIVRRRTLAGVDAFGNGFAPLSEWRVAERGAAGPILAETLAMLDSITTTLSAEGVGEVLEVRGQGVTTVSDEPKASAHIGGSWRHPSSGAEIGVVRNFLGSSGGLSLGGQRAAEERELKLIYKGVTGNQRVRLTWVTS